jgi:hypothetical protein
VNGCPTNIVTVGCSRCWNRRMCSGVLWNGRVMATCRSAGVVWPRPSLGEIGWNCGAARRLEAASQTTAPATTWGRLAPCSAYRQLHRGDPFQPPVPGQLQPSYSWQVWRVPTLHRSLAGPCAGVMARITALYRARQDRCYKLAPTLKMLP